MISRLGLRARLILALAALTSGALAVTFVATYRGTGSDVRSAVDADLRQDAALFARDGVPASATSTPDIERAARAFVARQPGFGTSARLYIVRVGGGATITNEPELIGLSRDRAVESETPSVQRRERAQAAAMRTAGVGLHTLPLVDAGNVRLLVQPVRRSGNTVADVGIGEPFDAVARAQAGVRRTFLLAGSLALLASLVAGYLLAGGLTRPLRRMARTAAEVDAGDRHHLQPVVRGSTPEIRVLARSFDHMLDRLDDAFARQRAFVADASHELRTPLTAIRGQVEVLVRQPHSTRQDVERVAGIVGTETARMQRLVEDLLLLARADEEQLVRPQELDVEPFVRELMQTLEPTAERRFEFGSVPRGTVQADPDRTAQVIRNLVRNAVEHTSPGGLVRLEARAERGRLQIAVEDDGPGIPPSERERVFDRFHRSDEPRTRAEGGTGLGLAIVKAIVTAHGGSVRVEQSASGGARVVFELPGFRPAR